eukprot:CAMPEP_0170077334 /NCGR_PEP_ID=MMETSP0019_2-20121128/14170_1 /TAXON_ID=98059 /ORGANISM="Dinobryon sp., Strain UTEXLB2267" /LENGTH=194 /DNA_ID=CAMNT_0010289597 /DNA_START=509 /DNA_END=1089 /DNA_ORIENTATION=-
MEPKIDANERNTENRAAAHTHVATHSAAESAEERTAFLSPEAVSKGQQDYLIKLITKFCSLAMTSRECGIDGCADLSLAIALCYNDFISLGIQPIHIWRAALNRINHSNIDANDGELESPVFVEEEEEEEEKEEGEKVEEEEEETTHKNESNLSNISATLDPESQLSMAISTLNEVAARQILQAFADSINLDYV